VRWRGAATMKMAESKTLPNKTTMAMSTPRARRCAHSRWWCRRGGDALMYVTAPPEARYLVQLRGSGHAAFLEESGAFNASIAPFLDSRFGSSAQA
jgi:pimeloyl-ACP methyl ester carboxylesterase